MKKLILHKITLLTVCCLLLSFSKVKGQVNLVLNPSFEDSTGTMWQYSNGDPNFYHLCKHWDNPTYGSPDYYYNYNTQGGAKHGIAYCGIGVFYENAPDSREYIQGTLSTPLVTNQVYNVSFFLKLDTISKWKICTLQVAFLASPQYSNALTNLSFLNSVDIEIGAVSSGNWTKCVGTYTAEGGETKFIIGNTTAQSQVTCKSIINATTQVSTAAYYRLDSMELSLAEVNGISEAAFEHFNIYPIPCSDKIYLKNVLPIEYVKIKNALGTVVYFYENPIQNYINIDKLTNGIYLAEVKIGNSVFSKKILVQK